MSLSSALSNALSGLRVQSRASDIISTNVSNSTTPGYARRELAIGSTSANFIGGVTEKGVVRITNPAILAARREADAGVGYAGSVSDFLSRLESAIGTPDDPTALSNMLAGFESSLLTAASRPDAVERLDAAVSTAGQLVDVIRDASGEISRARSEADANIDGMVTRLNAALEEVEHLNFEIASSRINGFDDSALLDLRQQVIDEIHQIVPVREAQRDNGQVALYTTGGVILIDGSAREVEFTGVSQVTPYMSLAGGHLSGLSIDGFAIQTGSQSAGIQGGTLAAQFAVRDELAPDALTQLDAAARDLVERFQDPAVDPTLNPGDAGLFTDDGLAFNVADEVGLAERLQLNAAVDPAQGGATWRIRDGMNAAVPGPVGQSALIDALRDALVSRRAPASGDFGTGLLSASDVTNSMTSRIGIQRLSADQSLSFASATQFEMAQAERGFGVDSDAELQRLIVVEQAYAANARVLETVESMMDTLLRIG